MKLVSNIQDDSIAKDFLVFAKNDQFNCIEILIAQSEKNLNECAKVGDVNAFIIDNTTSYYQKSIQLIKNKHPYIPILVIGKNTSEVDNVDIYIEINDTVDNCLLYKIIIKSIKTFERNFGSLQRLTIKSIDKINFDGCCYDPNDRVLFYKEREIAKLSQKNGGLLELLSMNFCKPIRKELILEKVWKHSDYYASRSMDVYVTNIRNILKKNDTGLTIKNISGKGLILEFI